MGLLELLNGQIDITRVPFSDRGSRLLVFQRPDESCLFVKLAERLIHVNPGLEDYLLRPAFIPALQLLDAHGSVLEYEVSASAEIIQFQTAIGQFSLVFQDAETLAFGLPAGATCGLRLQVQTELLVLNDQGGLLKHIRDLAYATDAKVLKNQVTILENGSLIEFIVEAGQDSVIQITISDKKGLIPLPLPFSQIRKNARERWQAWFEQVPPVAGCYQKKYAYAWWVMANNLVSPKGFVSYEAMMPTKAFYLGAWLWDSALHAIAFRHVDPLLAQNQLRLMLAHQLPDGMLPDAVFDEAVVSEIDHPIHARVTKPPILAWAAMKLHETRPDIDFLREIYPALVRWNAWWFDENDDDEDGLVQYTHPYSSGLDNSPLWDHGLPVESPDINTYLNLQMKALAVMADLLGRPDEAATWRQRAQVLTRRMIEDMWDEQKGVFVALHAEKPVPVLTPFNLYPLWTADLPENMAKRLVEHLENPEEFGGELMLPTVARSDPAYNPERMWAGPIWANINYFFVEALQKTGEFELASDLRKKTLNIIMQQPGMYEYYNSETGIPPGTAANMFGWTAAVFIELAIQETTAIGSTNT